MRNRSPHPDGATHFLPMQFRGPVLNGLNASMLSSTWAAFFSESSPCRNLCGLKAHGSCQFMPLWFMLQGWHSTMVPGATNLPAIVDPVLGTSRTIWLFTGG